MPNAGADPVPPSQKHYETDFSTSDPIKVAQAELASTKVR